MVYEYVEVGRFRKPFGTKGEIRLEVNSGYETAVDGATVLFAEQMGTYVPYFVESQSDQTGTVKVEEIDSPEATLEISGKTCYMRTIDLDMDTIPLTTSDYELLVGLEVISDGIPRGKILSIVEYPMQTMAQLTYNGKDYLIPITGELITDITEEQIVLSLADDFWEVFG